MKKAILFLSGAILSLSVSAQNLMTPDLLWQLGRVSGVGISKDGKSVVYRVTTPVVTENKNVSKNYSLSLPNGIPQEVTNTNEVLADPNLSPDGKFLIRTQEVKIQNVLGKDFYP